MLERAKHFDFNGHMSVRIPGSDLVLMYIQCESTAEM